MHDVRTLAVRRLATAARRIRDPERRHDGRSRRVDDDIFVRRDGRELPVAYTAAPFETDDGVHGCVVVFEDISERKSHEQSLQRDVTKLAWIGRIQAALAENRFVLYSQPIVDLRSGEVVQHELLLRLEEPEGEIVAPATFLADRRAVRPDRGHRPLGDQRGAELAASGLPVEINLSAQLDRRPGCAGHIERCIERERCRSDAARVRDHRDRADRRTKPPAGASPSDSRARLQARPRRLRHGLRRLHLPQAAPARLPQDRHRVRSRPGDEPRQPHVVQAVVALARGFELRPSPRASRTPRRSSCCSSSASTCAGLPHRPTGSARRGRHRPERQHMNDHRAAAERGARTSADSSRSRRSRTSTRASPTASRRWPTSTRPRSSAGSRARPSAGRRRPVGPSGCSRRGIPPGGDRSSPGSHRCAPGPGGPGPDGRRSAPGAARHAPAGLRAATDTGADDRGADPGRVACPRRQRHSGPRTRAAGRPDAQLRADAAELRAKALQERQDAPAT